MMDDFDSFDIWTEVCTVMFCFVSQHGLESDGAEPEPGSRGFEGRAWQQQLASCDSCICLDTTADPGSWRQLSPLRSRSWLEAGCNIVVAALPSNQSMVGDLWEEGGSSSVKVNLTFWCLPLTLTNSVLLNIYQILIWQLPKTRIFFKADPKSANFES